MWKTNFMLSWRILGWNGCYLMLATSNLRAVAGLANSIPSRFWFRILSLNIYIYIIFQLWSLCRFVVRIYAFVVASVRLQFHVSATCCQVHTPSHISSNHQPAINPRVGLRMFLYVLLSSGKRLQFANWKITKSSRAWQVNYFYVHFQYPKWQKEVETISHFPYPISISIG